MAFKPGMTNEQLKAEGYVFDNTNQCSGMACRREVLWKIDFRQCWVIV
jgi:hypothetical protein